jgi:hypothetical protein
LTIVQHGYFLAEVTLFVLDQDFTVVALGDVCLRDAVEHIAFLEDLYVEEAIIGDMSCLILVISLFLPAHSLSNG